MTRGGGHSLLLLALPLPGCLFDGSGGAQTGGQPEHDAAVQTSDAAQAADAATAEDAGQDAGTWLDAGQADAGPEADAGQPRDAAADALVDAGLADAGAAYPQLLSQTGLFSEQPEQLGAEVRAFEPRYKLWSDGASKRRWLYLPPDTQIDSSDMDAWRFPVGTKAWKEFAVAGVPVETRMLHKRGEDDWVMVSYRWLPDLSDAEAVPQGDTDALGTQHDIPSQELCLRCHDNFGDALLGASALQLSHALPGLNLSTLVAEERLSVAPTEAFLIPGGAVAEAALGYLHANCGHCHHPSSSVFAQLLSGPPYTGGPVLWEQTGSLDTLEQTVGYLSTVGQPNAVLPDLSIIEPGEPYESELYLRIGQRGPGSLQMPPVGTELVDESGRAAVKAWIEALSAQ